MRLRRVRRRFGPPSRNSWSRTASRLDGPLYVAADGGTPYQGGFGYSGMTVNVSVRHVRPGGELDIDTSDDRDWHGDGDYDDWRLATDWLHRALQPGRISFPLALKADRWLQDVAVDGRNVPFTLVGDDRTWCAVGTVGGQQISAAGTGWPHAALALVSVRPSAVSGKIPNRP